MITRRMNWLKIPFLASLAVFACAPADAPAPDEGGPNDAAAVMPADPVVVARGLNGPIGVLVDPDGTLWVADSGTGGSNEVHGVLGTGDAYTYVWGETARLVRVEPGGSQTDITTLPSVVIPEGPQGAGHIVRLGSALYVTAAGWAEGMTADRVPNMAAVVRVADGSATEFANTWDFENRENPEPAHRETNPYDLTVGPDSALWVTDAAGNTLYRIDPATGALELKAVFPAMPGPIPNALRGGAMEIEPVPTAVAFDDDGNTYVSLLGGLPFLPGSSKVVRVASDGGLTDYATDLTMLTDLVTGPDGRLYGVSIGEFTDQGPTPNSGAILRIGPGSSSEALVSGLSMPASIAFAPNGDAYVTINAIGAPGSGQVVKYAGLAR